MSSTLASGSASLEKRDEVADENEDRDPWSFLRQLRTAQRGQLLALWRIPAYILRHRRG